MFGNVQTPSEPLMTSVLRTFRASRKRRNGQLKRPVLSLETLEHRQVLATTVVINEFQTDNDGTLRDQFNETEDWVELHNPTLSPVNIGGWHLTDDGTDLSKWTFPDITLAPDEYLVVFTSGLNLTATDAPLHTNFQLDNDGEYLALVEADGFTIASEYTPAFPPQLENQSYGLAVGRDTAVFINADSAVKTFVPTNGTLGDAWQDVGFNDAAWANGTSAVGYEQFAAGFQIRDEFTALNAPWQTDIPAGGTSTVAINAGKLRMTVPAGQNTTATRGLAPLVLRDLPTTSADFEFITQVNFASGAGFAGIAVYDTVTGRPALSLEVQQINAAIKIIAGTTSGQNLGSASAQNSPTILLRLARNVLADSWTMQYKSNLAAPNWTNILTIAEGGTASTNVTLPQISNPRIGLVTRTAASAVTTDFEFVEINASSEPPVYLPRIGANVGAVAQNNNATVYTRFPFTIGEDPERFDELSMSVAYDDGFIAYLNGTEVARRNAPASVTFDSAATASHNADGANIPIDRFNLNDFIELLQQGENVLSFQALNVSAADKDLYLEPVLTASDLLPKAPQYFVTPTPDAENTLHGAPVPIVSESSGSFVGSKSVSLSVVSDYPLLEIRYTTDGTTPTPTSPLYTGPINITGTTWLRSKTFDAGIFPAFVASNEGNASYVAISAATSTFNSNLPILVIDTQGAAYPDGGGSALARGLVSLYDVDEVTGRATIGENLDYAGLAGLRRRGSSTAGALKPSLKFEIWGQTQNDFDASLLGMPADSDWVLYSPYEFDRTLLHEPFAHGLSNDMGRYAVRTQFVEVYSNNNGGAVDQSDYFGVYVLQEQIKIAPDRVDIQKINENDNAQPDISGGYIFSIDRPVGTNPQFSAGGQTINFVDPEIQELTVQQRQYATDYINEFVATLNGPNFADPVDGYAKYIDVDAWIDHHLHNVFTFNVDALRLSAYFYKDRGGKLTFGPVWDFDRTMGSTDGRDSDPNVWRSRVGDLGTDFFGYPWWARLFQDGNFWQKYVDRWNELRQGVLSDDAIDDRIDGLAAQVDEAQVRNFAKWTAVPPRSGAALPFSDLNGWTGEVENMRNFLKARAAFMDRNFAPEPAFQLNGQNIPYDPQGLTITRGAQIGMLSPAGPEQVIRTDTVILNGNPGVITARYFVPANDSLGTTWTAPGFNDGSWSSGPMGLGYETTAADYATLLRTQVNPNTVAPGSTSLMTRITFNPGDTSAINDLILQMKYDDGFVAYLNGTEVARANIGGVPTWNGLATDHPDGSAVVYDDFNITTFKNLLVPNTTNTLAIFAQNSATTSSDMLIQPQIVSRTTVIIPPGETAGAVYYTTDGTDPRGSDGRPTASAIAYNPSSLLIPANANVRYIVPNGAAAENGWQNVNYSDGTWTSGSGALGFDRDVSGVVGQGQPGFFVRTVKITSGLISDIGVATGLLDGTVNYTGLTGTAVSPVVNYGTNGAGDFAGADRPPGLAASPVDTEDYAIRATAKVTIPVGTYTIAAASDDGVSVTIPGVVFTSKSPNEFTGVGVQRPDQIVWGAPRGNAQTLGTFTVSGAPLETTIELDFYERGGGDTVELSITSGQTLAFSTGTFQLLADGVLGWDLEAAEIVSNRIDYTPTINTDVATPMLNVNTSLYARVPFNVTDANRIKSLAFNIKYDDGFVAYLNGTEVARRNAPATLNATAAATAIRADASAIVAESIDLSSFRNLLSDGNNVLALHALNRTAANTDFLLAPSLTAVYSGVPIVLNETTRIFARNFDISDRGSESALVGTDWSAPVIHDFIIETPALSITEFNYNPYAPTAAELATNPALTAGDFEFVEIQNTGSTTADLTGVKFSNGITFDFTGSSVTSLAPGAYALVASNPTALALRYGNGLPVAGQYSGALSNAGERLTLSDGVDNVVFTVEYVDTDPWSPRADGGGATLVLNNPSTTSGVMSEKFYNWRGSTEYGGSPGAVAAPPMAVVINEVLSRTDAIGGPTDAVELYNPTNSPITIGGWYLSDSEADLLKFQIPVGTVLGPKSYIVFDEGDFNPTPTTPGPKDFAFDSAEGDSVYLVVPGGVTGVQSFVDDVEFGAASDGESFGRTPNGTGRLTPQARTTLGCQNTSHDLGSLLISEVVYRPSAPTAADLVIEPTLTVNNLEFLEIHNPSTATVSLTNWLLRGGVDYDFVTGTSLAGGASLVVVSFNPTTAANANRVAAFRNHYGISNAVTIVGGLSGAISDIGERITLFSPDAPPIDQPLLIPQLQQDEITYDNLAPWATSADGTGNSLQRLAPTFYGNFATAWSGATPTPGTVTFPGTIAGDLNGDGVANGLDIDVMSIALADGVSLSFLDVNSSGGVDAADRTHLIQNILHTVAGDANLDRTVDGSDFNAWNSHKFADCFVGWGQGDWSGDGRADATDFNSWNSAKFTVVAPAPVAGSTPRAALGAQRAVVDAAFAAPLVSQGETTRVVRRSTGLRTVALPQPGSASANGSFDYSLGQLTRRSRSLRGGRLVATTDMSQSTDAADVDSIFAQWNASN